MEIETRNLEKLGNAARTLASLIKQKERLQKDGIVADHPLKPGEKVVVPIPEKDFEELDEKIKSAEKSFKEMLAKFKTTKKAEKTEKTTKKE